MSLPQLPVWLQASRPQTLWAAVAPVFIGSAMARADDGFQLPAALTALFGAVMIQIGTNLANDFFDFSKGADTPDRTGPIRVTQAGLVSATQIKRAILIAFGLAFCAGIYLVLRGGWPIVIIGAASILFGVLYTGGPFPLGYHGLGELFVFIFFGPVAVGGTYYVQTLDINSSVLVAGLSPGLISVAILSVNNLRDIDSDKRAGKRTLAVRFGRTFARVEYVAAVTLAILIPVALVLAFDGRALVLVSLAAFLPAILPLRMVTTGTAGAGLNGVLAATARVLLIYSLLFTFGWLW